MRGVVQTISLFYVGIIIADYGDCDVESRFRAVSCRFSLCCICGEGCEIFVRERQLTDRERVRVGKGRAVHIVQVCPAAIGG